MMTGVEEFYKVVLARKKNEVSKQKIEKFIETIKNIPITKEQDKDKKTECKGIINQSMNLSSMKQKQIANNFKGMSYQQYLDYNIKYSINHNVEIPRSNSNKLCQAFIGIGIIVLNEISLKKTERDQQRQREQEEKQKSVQEQIYNSPFQKQLYLNYEFRERNKHILKLNQDLEKLLSFNQDLLLRPQTKYGGDPKYYFPKSTTNLRQQTGMSEFKQNNEQDQLQNSHVADQSKFDNQIQQSQQQIQFQDLRQLQETQLDRTNRQLSQGQQIYNQSFDKNVSPQTGRSQLPPKTPGRVYDDNNNPVISDYVSTYDQQHSHKLKVEKSNIAKQLNSINEQYLKSLLGQSLKSVRLQDPPINLKTEVKIQDPPILPEPQQISDDWEKQNQMLRLQQEQEERDRKLRLQIERQMREELRRKQYESQTQTDPEKANVGIQHIDHNAVTASEYMGTLQNLSSSVIDMKNQFIHEQTRLNHQLIQLRNDTQREIEEKLRIQEELRELERKHLAYRIWEGDHQRKLINALDRNAPVLNVKSQSLDYKNISPNVNKIVRFRDQTQGYSYDEPNAVLSKSNLMPLDHQNYEYNNLHKLKQEAPFIPEEHEQINQNTLPKLNYTNDITRQIRLNDMNNNFYDYSYGKQKDLPGGIQFETNYRDQDYDPNKILLENDRRLHELNIIDPYGDKKQIEELYNYL
ncbi:hypothetical protein pb186bvf_004559 [Paramecium bursaria]